MTNKVFKETKPYLLEKYGKEKTDLIMNDALKIYDSLCKLNASEPKAVKAQTFGNAYPAISLYKALLNNDIAKEEAFEFMDFTYSARAKKSADLMNKAFKIPGLYKLYPRMFKMVANKQFGEAAGFKSKFYDTEKTRCKFDMTKCLYCDVCKREGCFELVPCFCHTDDINNANLHPKLIWNRKRFMGKGDDCCDFDIFVSK